MKSGVQANLGYVETMLQDKEIHAVFFFTQNSSLLKKQDIRIWGNKKKMASIIPPIHTAFCKNVFFIIVIARIILYY